MTEHKESYAVVGELMMLWAGLDFLTNRVLIAVLDLGKAPLLEPVVATLDLTRKIEILKVRADQMPEGEWKKHVHKFCGQVEKVNRQRNIISHTTPVLRDGAWTFQPIAAAKMLKALDLETQTLKQVPIQDLRDAIRIGEEALAAGIKLVEQFERVNGELKKRTKAAQTQNDAEEKI